MVHVSAVFLVVSAATVATAFNDWNTPCFNGACQYSLPSSSGNSPSGTLKIWGSVNAISDITGAAGWEILGCSPDAEAQDIRLVCKSDSSHDCAHLYQNIGAVGKIVRLPENCGKSAFARVAKAWTPTDQSIPSSIASRVVRRDGTQPTVRALQLDTSWHEIDASKAGNVNIAIQGANFPGVSPNISTADIATRSSRVFDRGLFDFVGKAVKAIKKLDSFDVDKNKDLKPLDVDKKFNLVDKSISCPPISASVKVDVDAKAHAVASIGIAAHGTIIPPKIKDFAITASITADLDGSLDLVADVTGTLDSGKIKIFETAIAGLDFPGILSIGPTFQVNAQATASLDAQVNLNIGLNYHIDKAALTFPPKKGSGGGAFQIGDTRRSCSRRRGCARRTRRGIPWRSRA